MREVITNWTGTDAELLAELNTPRHKRVVGDGMVTLAMVGAVSVELAASLNYTLEQMLLVMPQTNDAEKAQVSLLNRFADRLTVSDRGLDMSNDAVRGQLTAILTAAGWDLSTINAVLDLGAVYDSEAYQTLGRDATQEDIDAVRKQLLIATTSTAVHDQTQPAITRRNNANATLDSVDLSTMTLAELQTFCDSVLASENGVV